ncbi:MAG: hypothetical protein H7Z73_12385 [Candidatus Saccharibacteria bacterium]|nr:hypothetical protein [Moraxellaceae bacterium]
MKTCSKCKEYKSEDNFFKNKSNTSGLRGDCKVCSKKAHIKYLQNNPEKNREYSQTKYNKDPQKEKDRVLLWRQENKDKVNEYQKKWSELNREKYLIRMRDKNRGMHKKLPERYVVRKFFRGFENVPIELINLKRCQILLNRELRQMEQQA